MLVQHMKKEALASGDIDSSVAAQMNKTGQSFASLTPASDGTRREVLPNFNDDMPTPAL